MGERTVRIRKVECSNLFVSTIRKGHNESCVLFLAFDIRAVSVSIDDLL